MASTKMVLGNGLVTKAAIIWATTQTVPSTIRPISLAPTKLKEYTHIVVPKQLKGNTSHTISSHLPTRSICAQNSIAGISQVRFAHSDLKAPDYSEYRKKSTLDPHRRTTHDTIAKQRVFSYLMIGGGSAVGVYSAKKMVHYFLGYLSAPADVLAMAKIEIHLNDIPEGKNVTFKWRGKPLFVRHRSADEIAKETAVPMSVLRDPEPDTVRAERSQWLVVIGVCTHLGCVPIANAGDYGGYYCPCHGSHYDAAGRIRKGPAPLNLEIPPIEYVTDDLLIVG